MIGTWANGASGLAAAFAGQSSPLMPSLNQSFPAPGGLDNRAVTALLMICGVTIVIALVLTLVGSARSGRSRNLSVTVLAAHPSQDVA